MDSIKPLTDELTWLETGIARYGPQSREWLSMQAEVAAGESEVAKRAAKSGGTPKGAVKGSLRYHILEILGNAKQPLASPEITRELVRLAVVADYKKGKHVVDSTLKRMKGLKGSLEARFFTVLLKNGVSPSASQQKRRLQSRQRSRRAESRPTADVSSASYAEE
jgi:hypothetical protein